PLLRSAERVFLSYQRSDESGKEMLPSPLIGGRGFQGAQSENFPRLRANQIKKTVVESPFLLNAGDLAAAVDPSDLDLLEPLFGVRAVNALGRSRKLGRLMNHKGDCHGFDGIVITGGDARLGSILEDFREKNRLGFSALWDLMTCPFRFFAGTILGAGGLEIEEKPSLDLEHAPAGEMLHGILADLFEKGDMKGCDGFIKKAFDKFRRELAVLPSAIAGLRKGEIEEIVSTVASFYGSAGGDATFITEKPYGISRGEKYKGKMSLSKGRFEIVFPFNFALRIDRITEEKNGGAVEIMDYKYSKGEKRRLGSGNFRNLFQLILYELAYRLREKKEKSGSIILKLLQMKEIPLSGVEEATFDYCAGLGEAAPELAEEFIKRMSLADMAFSNGAFFPVANDACKYCEFSGFCRKDNYYTEMRLVENPLYAKFTGSVEDEDE
ncbi:MAG: PD-(D/E)XK nuclease family protein, partial [Deltaproteobacteria bacterium]|nr:PD-(D/E)XK nuclease family protein [Deltaproteobacteria bacterium]